MLPQPPVAGSSLRPGAKGEKGKDVEEGDRPRMWIMMMMMMMMMI